MIAAESQSHAEAFLPYQIPALHIIIARLACGTG